MATLISATARLRDRNQLTIPDPIARAAGIEVGDSFVVEIEPSDPDVLRLRRVRDSYAGALVGLYGDSGTYVESERRSWEEDETEQGR